MASQDDLRYQFLVGLMKKAEDALHVLDQKLKWGSIIKWDTFRTLLRQLYQDNFRLISSDHNSNYFTHFRGNFEKLLFKILTLFHTHKCPDISVISDVAELLCSVSCRYPCQCRLLESSTQTSMSKFEMTLVFPYRNNASLVHIEMPENECFAPRDWVCFLAFSGKARLLQTIISFGATLIVPKVRIDEEIEVAITMGKLFKPMQTDEEEIMSFESRIRQNYKSKFNNYSRKRGYLLRMLLFILSRHDFHEKRDEYIECARILILSTPEPLITSDEIKTFLTELCCDIISNDELLHFMEKYESIFPESRDVSAPRSLVHLTRFQVRENLRIARSFPHGVKLLFVPKKIADYICLKDIACCD